MSSECCAPGTSATRIQARTKTAGSDSPGVAARRRKRTVRLSCYATRSQATLANRARSCSTISVCLWQTRDSLMLVLQDEAKLGNKILLKLVQLLSERLRQTSAKLVSYLEASREA